MPTLAIMQPYFFPYLGYFQLMASADAFLPYDLVSFRRKSYITRNHLVTPHGELTPIGLAVQKQPLGAAISSVFLVENDQKARLDRQLRTLYGRYEHFPSVYEALCPLLHHPATSLADYNTAGLQGIAQLLAITTEFYLPETHRPHWSAIEASLETDPPADGDRASHRILRLCHGYGADRYLNPPGGRTLYAPALFSKHGITLSFLEPDLNGHRPGAAAPLQYASIIDVLMVNGIRHTQELVHRGHRATIAPS